MRRKLLILMLFVLFSVLSIAVLQMPTIGSVDHPAYNETAQYYIDNAIADTGAVNVIAAIITDYRAFDTLGETTVLFTAIAAVGSVLVVAHKKEDSHE